MNKISKIFISTCALIITAAALATTVIPPSFAELVSRAEVIFQGTVSGVRSEWTGEGAQRHIVSYVTFSVDDALKGNAGRTMTLQMMGGTVGDETMEVTDAPKFKVGDRDILFVEHNGTQFIPLVGIMHGRFHVKNDESGREVVLTNDGQALSDVTQLGKEQRAVTAQPALSTQEFKQAIRNTATRSAVP